MEVVGLTASLITLVGATSLAGSTISRIWGLHETPPTYILVVLNELKYFKTTLSIVQNALQYVPATSPDPIDTEIVRYLARADTALNDFNNYLHRKVICGKSDGVGAVKLEREPS